MTCRQPQSQVLARRLPRILCLLLVSACSHIQPYPALDTPDVAADPQVQARLILVGDAGRPVPGVLAAVRAWSDKAPESTTVVYLGDNIYEDGLPPGPAVAEKAVLDQLIAAVGPARGIFVPGNHDWRAGRSGIERQADYVQRSGASIRLLPAAGCPGPATDDALDGVRLLVLDTDWLLQPAADASGCDLGADASSTISRRLGSAVAQAGDDVLVVVAHHPPRTYGPHGGFFDWRDHLFPLTRIAPWAWLPLPLVGSLYPLGRARLAHDQDAYSKHYRAMQADLATAFSGYRGARPLIFAGGHDHSLQVLARRQPSDVWDYVLVSGAASVDKLTAVTHGPDTMFAHLAHGFMTLDVYSDGRVLLRVIESEPVGVAFTRWLTAR